MKKAKTDLLEIAYLEAGEANEKVVLLLHGWPDDASTWDKVTPSLADAGYRTIAPFFRGFGETRFLDAATPLTGNPGRGAMDNISLMDVLGVDQFYVIGHDWGSNIAEAMVVGWPDRIKKLIQISTPSRLGGLPTPPFKLARLEWYHWFQATERGAEAVRKDPVGFGRIMWDTWSPAGWFEEATFNNVSKSWLNPDFVDITLHSYRSRWDEAPLDPSSEALEQKIKSTKTLSLPAVFLSGEEDGVNRPWVTEKVAEKFTGPFQRIILPGVGHFPQREAPEEVARILIDFLAKE